MEHHWGRRMTARQSLVLQSAPDVETLGFLLNASVSGAYVATRAVVRRVQRFTLLLPSPLWLNLSGFVVRTDESGFGLEWEVFAAEAVRALLLSLGSRP
jgi:hypothetical protein